MKFSSLTGRIAGESVDAWEVHYEALERREAGEDIIVLSVGQETDEVTADVIVESAVTSLRNGRHHYTQIQGTMELRKAIARRHGEITGQAVGEHHCAVFSGAQNALFAVAQCVLEHGDEVILIEPYYTTYPATFTASGATAVSVPARRENSFALNPHDVIAAVTEKTRAIVLNSPNNPVGVACTLKQFEPLVEVCRARGIWLINDDVYQELLLPKDRASPASLAGAGPVCVTVSSLSKSHRMTGWRLGWVVAPLALIEHLYNLSLCMAYGLPEFILDAAVTALQSGTHTVDQVRHNMDTRRGILYRKLENIESLSLYSAPGGMYVALDISRLPVSSRQFARDMLDRHNVSVLPCDGFGATGKGLIRVSLCVPDDQLAMACERIVAYVCGLVDRIPSSSRSSRVWGSECIR